MSPTHVAAVRARSGKRGEMLRMFKRQENLEPSEMEVMATEGGAA